MPLRGQLYLPKAQSPTYPAKSLDALEGAPSALPSRGVLAERKVELAGDKAMSASGVQSGVAEIGATLIGDCVGAVII